jgi:hypothetical protein
MDATALDAALQTEYLHLQKSIEDFDGKAMTIKAWSVTFSFSVVVGAFASHAAAVLLVAAVSALLFWFLETMWKAFQLGYYERAAQIEAHFRGETPLLAAHQIGVAWMRRWRRVSWTEIARMACWPHVALPHAVVVALGAGLFIASLLGALKP